MRCFGHTIKALLEQTILAIILMVSLYCLIYWWITFYVKDKFSDIHLSLYLPQLHHTYIWNSSTNLVVAQKCFLVYDLFLSIIAVKSNNFILFFLRIGIKVTQSITDTKSLISAAGQLQIFTQNGTCWYWIWADMEVLSSSYGLF